MAVFLEGAERISIQIAVDFEQLQTQSQHEASSGLPERKLLAAILERAVRDALSNPPIHLLKQKCRKGLLSGRHSGNTAPELSDKQDAIKWIFTDGYSPLREDCRDGWTVSEICEYLGVNVERIRALIVSPVPPQVD